MGNIVVFGGDGYIGWCLAIELAAAYPDKEVVVLDNFLTRRNVEKVGGESLLPIRSMAERIAAHRSVFGRDNLSFREMDCADSDAVAGLFAELKPEVVYHLAHQRAAPYSMLGMKEAVETIVNNETGFLNVIWAMKDHCPDAHLVKLGSFGAYAKPGLDIPEGDSYITLNGKTSSVPVPFPRASDDFYHITKINDGNFAGLACRKWHLKITDVMQSTVFGVFTDRTIQDPRLCTRFDYDEIFGTVLNRFVTQAIAGLPLTVYGTGEQTSGIMVLSDCIRVLTRLAYDAPEAGHHRIVNNCPDKYSINELAEIVRSEFEKLGSTAKISRNEYNPRFESGISYDYRAMTDYMDSFMKPTDLASAVAQAIGYLMQFGANIDHETIMPTHTWTGASTDMVEGFTKPAAAHDNVTPISLVG